MSLTLIAVLAVGCDLSNDTSYSRDRIQLPLVVIDAFPRPGATDVLLNQPITLWFNQYLDPSSFEYFNAVNISSGGIGARGFVRYNATDRSLTFFPSRELLPDLIYQVTINPDTVRALNGEALFQPFSMPIQTAATGVVQEQGRRIETLSFAEDIGPALAGCSCHFAVGSELVRLDYDSLIDVRSPSRPDRYLVRPFFAEESYLLHKVLPGYPDRTYDEMPPRWGEQAPLGLDLVQRVEDWIATGAAP